MVSFCTFNLIQAKTQKKKKKKKKKTIRNYFSNDFDKICGKHKKHLALMGTPASVSNNYLN